MKKKFLSVITIVITLIISFSACGKKVSNLHLDKTQIYIRVYNGGTGVAWIEDLAEEWSETNSDYQVIIYGDDKPNVASMAQEIRQPASGTSPSAWFSSAPDFQNIIYNDYLEDLSDVLEMKPEGEKTIKEKMQTDSRFYEKWEQASSKYGEGMYMLPYADAMLSFVYEHDYFVEKGWLKFANISEIESVKSDGIDCTVQGNFLISNVKTSYYKIGDKILSAGKDGKYGTYDDGQPETIAEWEDMLNAIQNSNTKDKVFIWNGVNTDYAQPIAFSLMAQYGGLEEFETYFSFDSANKKIQMHSGESKAISIDNGYDVYNMESMYQAYKFTNDYLCNTNYLHSVARSGTASHMDSQNNYLLGYRNETRNPRSAMLLDGLWWENEARVMFKSLETANRGYGQIDYRYMLIPKLEGQKGIDGEGNGTVLSVVDNSSIVIKKTNDKEKLAALKEFLVYTLTDTNLRRFTVQTGIVRPYDYDLTEEDKSKLTPFARTAWDIYKDKENISLVRPMISAVASPMTFASGSTINNQTKTPMKINGALTSTIMSAINASDLDRAFNALKTYYTAAEWAALVTNARNANFYGGAN